MRTVDTAIADPTAQVDLRSIQTCLRVTIVSILVGHKEVILGRSIWFCIVSIVMQLGWGRHHIGLGFRLRNGKQETGLKHISHVIYGKEVSLLVSFPPLKNF